MWLSNYFNYPHCLQGVARNLVARGEEYMREMLLGVGSEAECEAVFDYVVALWVCIVVVFAVTKC